MMISVWWIPCLLTVWVCHRSWSMAGQSQKTKDEEMMVTACVGLMFFVPTIWAVFFGLMWYFGG